MVDFFEFGEDFLNSLLTVGDFLLNYPINLGIRFREGLIKVFETLRLDGLAKIASVANGMAVTGNYSVAYYIFGGGLVAIIMFKIIKFFLDIVL